MLQEIVFNKLTEEELHWLNNNIQQIEKDELGNHFILIYSLIFRFIGNSPITWNTEELEFFKKKYPSFSKNTWSKHSLCRGVIMTKLPIATNKTILKNLLNTCSVRELVDFHKNLFFLENAKDLTSMVEEGIRTNTTDVLDAIALNNPYSANFLTDDAWNQLVLKAIFTERPLYKIYGLLERRNTKLALILNDFIRERWAAGRTVSPEVWQLMEGYDHPEITKTIKEAIATTNELAQKALQIILKEKPQNTTENKAIWAEIGKQFNT